MRAPPPANHACSNESKPIVFCMIAFPTASNVSIEYNRIMIFTCFILVIRSVDINDIINPLKISPLDNTHASSIPVGLANSIIQ